MKSDNNEYMEELDFLIKPIHPTGYLEQNYHRLKYDVIADEKYQFSLLLGKSWKIVDIKPKRPDYNENLSRIGLFRKNTEPKGEIEVMASLIPREVNPADWLELWLLKQEANIINGRSFQTDYGTVGDFLAIIQKDNKTIVLRTYSIKDANRIFTVVCRAQEQYYNELAEDFLLAISSIELVNPSRKKFAEKMIPYEFSAPVAGSFYFPASWEMKPDKHNSKNSYALTFYNYKDEVAVGAFTFSAVSTGVEKSVEGLLENYLSNFTDNGFKVKAEYLLEINEHNPDVQQVEIQIADKPGNPWELSVIFYKQADVICMFGLLSFVDPEYYDIHIINKRAWEVAFATFKTE